MSATTESPPEQFGPTIGLDTFVEVVEYFETPLLRYVGRLIGYHNAETEDIVQEAFIRLHKCLTEATDPEKTPKKAWLYRVAHNLAMDVGRKTTCHRKHHETIKNEAQREEIEDSDVLATVIQTEAGQSALNELEMLQEEERQIILLKTVQDLKLREISEITGLSINKVSYKLNQGLKTLASRMREGGHLDG